MRSKKLSDDFNNKVTVRLSDMEYHYIHCVSDIFNISKSEAIRKIIDKSMSGMRGVGTHENKEKL